MTRAQNPVDVERVLEDLKDFQRRTVDHVFERLYADDSRGRFLVADEVGLGKTLVARGVIAKTIEHLRDKVDRIDVVYICSNADIAAQNINRLRVAEGEQITYATRLTLLPTQIGALRETKTGINFVSFTPATSFDLKSGLGRREERVLLYWMLRQAWGFGGGRAAQNVLQGHVSADRFRSEVAEFDAATIDSGTQEAFERELARHPHLRRAFDELCSAFSTSSRRIAEDDVRARTRLVGELRSRLAASCVEALEPDLVILDEFQRFSQLLHGDDDAAELARQIFEFSDPRLSPSGQSTVRVLLLSATPYKMFSLADDPEDHYAEFVAMVRFLEGADLSDTSLERLLRDYRAALYEAADSREVGRLAGIRDAVETRLRRVMVRTERLASTIDRNGMLREVVSDPPSLQESDVADYLTLQRVAREVEHADTMEYWKSTPYALSFLDEHYALKQRMQSALDSSPKRKAITAAVDGHGACALGWQDLLHYRSVDARNPRLRSMLRDVVAPGAWQLLWIPPALPYYGLGGQFGSHALEGLTKRLVFSSWRVVPRAVSSLLSYEVERLMVAQQPDAENTPESRRRLGRLLRFARSDGRLTGMPLLALLYPSLVLARLGDPARLVSRLRGTEPDAHVGIDGLLAEARASLEISLARLGGEHVSGPVDERWYWAAPLLLDSMLEPVATQAWLGQRNLASAWSGVEAEDSDGEPDLWSEHVAEATRMLAGGRSGLGARPEDLLDVLAMLAVAGPAVCMFRALDRVVGRHRDEKALDQDQRTALRNAAGRTAWAFRSLFNQPEVSAMLRSTASDEPYWRMALKYCVDGCLQAVLDEYIHVLRDHLGLLVGTVGERAGDIAEEVTAALSLRTSRVAFDELTRDSHGRISGLGSRSLRTHFALRFGDVHSEDDKRVARADLVRKAFNSPFWPFVLVTTSVGQEGLDFHSYCHAVVHWNLPTNPVDLEQREGRVHRYKGHAVRKNVAHDFGALALHAADHDLWESMFARALGNRSNVSSDIVPYWIYTGQGPARIERHVPSLPLSREREQLVRLSRTLAIYRMVFGQPRQEDLVRYLTERAQPEQIAELMRAGGVDLSPVAGRGVE